MRILGIHDGHNATARLYDSGRIVAIVSEERFSRKKNQSGFPGPAVQWLVTTTRASAGSSTPASRDRRGPFPL